MKISSGNVIVQIGKHFGVILLHYITFCTTLYTLPHIKDTYPALFIIIGRMELIFFSPITQVSSSS